jgi:hypothetical protein
MDCVTCHACGTQVEGRVGVRDTCPSCHAYLHCCRNCKLYSPSSHNHCLSLTTEYVTDEAGSNFCEEFEGATGKPAKHSPESGKSRFDQLFGP